MKKLLFIHTTQFGYHNNAYMYCKYLKDIYDISFVCNDQGRKRISLDGVNVAYIPRINKYINVLFYYIYALYRIWKHDGVIFVFYFNRCDILKRLLPNRYMILDIRTLAVTENVDFNKKWDERIKKSVLLYDYVTYISEGVKDKVKCESVPSSILPLGAEIISSREKDYSKLRLLYVGTLYKRKIEDTIKGLKLFVDNYPMCDIIYHIIGDGYGDEVSRMKSLVSQLKLDNYVYIHGRIPHTEINSFFDECNIGVSYIPITEYYNYQPPTKTFEYAMSGLFTIATGTNANKEIVNSQNGIIINDNSESFFRGLSDLYKKKDFDEFAIRESLVDYRWDSIIYKKLLPVLESAEIVR